jgi:hypothetical protein
MRKLLFAVIATAALAAPFAASADEIIVRDHPTVREHVIRDHVYDRAPPHAVIREHGGPRGDDMTIRDR